MFVSGNPFDSVARDHLAYAVTAVPSVLQNVHSVFAPLHRIVSLYAVLREVILLVLVWKQAQSQFVYTGFSRDERTVE